MSLPPQSGGSTPSQAPQYIMDEVKLLLGSIPSPEAAVPGPPGRADTSAIQNAINPPATTWAWSDAAARNLETVTTLDIGKYGLQSDIGTLFQLTSTSPVSWEAVQIGSSSTWTWQDQSARAGQPVTIADIGKVGLQSDINVLYRLTSALPAIWQAIPNPNNSSSPFELSVGAADADSFHDFYRLHIAFEDVWAELLDSQLQKAGEQLYAVWDAVMSTYDATGRSENIAGLAAFANDMPPAIGSAKQLQDFVNDLKLVLGVDFGASSDSPAIEQLRTAVVRSVQASQMIFDQLWRVGDSKGGQVWSKSWLSNTASTATDDYKSDLAPFSDQTGEVQRQEVFQWILDQLGTVPTTTFGDVTVPDLSAMLQAMDAALSERYAFDIFAPASINFGLLLNYRQHWSPQSYQVGNLVSTIPLAPQEVRRYSTKKVVKKTRNVKEIDEALRSGRDESSNTSRTDSEIVDRAKNQTNFQKNASGSFGNDALYKVSSSVAESTDQAVESAQTKREFHEAVVKSAQEYKNEHRTEIETSETDEDEANSSQEIRNPNDELTVTYLFYELQRRYLVSEALHKVTPVVYVANEVPSPDEVDPAWLLRHDWIIRRAILDDSFIGAIDYLSTNYTGEEVTLQVLKLSVEQQKAVVDNIAAQVSLANDALKAATLNLTTAESKEVTDLQNAEKLSIVKSIFDPLGISQAGKGDGNSDRARVDFAKDALARAQAKADQFTSNLRSETTALQVAIDKYTAAATRHFSMLADIDRLRIHVKDNIIYYMQAIWSYEPLDQRYFRLYNYEVPVFDAPEAADVTVAGGLAGLDPTRKSVNIGLRGPRLSPQTRRLHEIADLDNLLGFKGNYMIFPQTEFDYMTWFLIHPYVSVDDVNGVTAQDPDPAADLTLDQLQAAMAAIHAQNPSTFDANQKAFEEMMLRLLSTQEEELVVVPSNSLYIEALPGTHPILEDFKLEHRAVDLLRAKADLRHAELENLRLGARIASGVLGDPDIDRVVVVGPGQNVLVDAGQ